MMVKKILRKTRSEIKKEVNIFKNYLGNEVYCPYCSREFSTFKPSGALNREFWKSDKGQEYFSLSYVNVANAKCPKCGSGERHRLLYYYLLRKNFFSANMTTALEIAPDEFTKKIFDKIRNLEYISTDIHFDRFPDFISDITNSSIKDNSIDFILCYHVLEHIENDMKAMTELYRILKPGGKALIQVPIWAPKTEKFDNVPREDYEKVYGHWDHVRIYGLDFYNMLREIGFDVVLDDFAETLDDEFVSRNGIFKTEELCICIK